MHIWNMHFTRSRPCLARAWARGRARARTRARGSPFLGVHIWTPFLDPIPNPFSGPHPGPLFRPLFLDPFWDTPQCRGINPIYGPFGPYIEHVYHGEPALPRARAGARAPTRAYARAREPHFRGSRFGPLPEGVQKWVKMPKS